MIDEDGKVFTWGCGFFGRLGHGDESSRNTPTFVETLRSRQRELREFYFSLFLNNLLTS